MAVNWRENTDGLPVIIDKNAVSFLDRNQPWDNLFWFLVALSQRRIMLKNMMKSL